MAIERNNTAIERLGVNIERRIKEQTRLYMLASAVQLAAILGLYFR